MKKTNFWLVQIAMVAIISLVFGSPVVAGPDKVKNQKVVTVSDDEMTHGEEMRLENANMDSGNAEWKAGDTGGGSECSADFPALCDTAEKCSSASGAWFPDFGGCWF